MVEPILKRVYTVSGYGYIYIYLPFCGLWSQSHVGQFLLASVISGYAA